MSDLAFKVVQAVRKKFGDTSARLLSDGGKSNVTEVIPMGIDVLDRYVLGVGGLPVGRLIEVFGDEASGKTSLLLQAVAGVQREGGVAMLAEPENALQDDRARLFGADLSKVITLDAGCIEDFFAYSEAAMDVIPAGAGPALLGWDSIAATPTRREVEEGLQGEAKIGEKARALSQKMPLICKMAMDKRVTLFFVNQIREKIGVLFGDNTVTPGGHAVKFHATVRLRLYSGKATKDGTEHVGKDVTISAAKNKLAPPWRKAKVRLNYEMGWDNDWSTLNHAKEQKLIESRARGASALENARQQLGWSNAEEEKSG